MGEQIQAIEPEDLDEGGVEEDEEDNEEEVLAEDEED